jgi:hypothetical protein
VPLDSSAARIPLPFATIAAAVFDRSAVSIAGVKKMKNRERKILPKK